MPAKLPAKMAAMTLADYLQELAYPARSQAALIALGSFWLLLVLAGAAGFLGLWLGLLVSVGLFRYLTMIAAARARGKDAAPPGIESFGFGDFWSLAPALLIILAAAGVRTLGELYGDGAALALALGVALLLPATVALLVITRSPLESLNPFALYRLLAAVGPAYLYAPFTAALAVLLPYWLDFLPRPAGMLLGIYLLAALFAVCGAMTRAGALLDEVDIPAPLEPDANQQTGRLERQRRAVLDHAYGFVSRGNRDGGLRHVYRWLEEDPDPDDGWRWFFTHMLEWRDRDHALYFAQAYLGRLLARGERVAAIKLLLRGRMENEQFRPLAADLPAAIEAAEATGNADLADTLSRL